MKILIINGSHRKGNTDTAVNRITELLSGKHHIIREIKLREIEMKLPDGCEKCAEGEPCPNIKDQFSEEIEPSIRNYDIYILATPTWSDNVTPLTKIFWDRIVSWCSGNTSYLKGKRLAVINHGMGGKKSSEKVINWVKGVCIWEGCQYGGDMVFKSGAKIGAIKLSQKKVRDFVRLIQGTQSENLRIKPK